MADRRRTKALNVRMLDEEHAMLDALAARDGLSVSDWIRLRIRTAHRKAFGGPSKTEKPTKKP